MNFFGRYAATSLTNGSTTIWAITDDICMLAVTIELISEGQNSTICDPKNHVRIVKHGNVGSAVIGTMSRTCWEKFYKIVNKF